MTTVPTRVTLSQTFRADGRLILFLLYNLAGAAVLSATVLLSYFRFHLFSTDLVLGGYDSALYVWYGDLVKEYGPWFYAQFSQYPALYVQLIGLTGNLLGSVVLAQRAIPVVLGIVRILILSYMTYRITRNVHAAGLTAVLTSISIGSLWLVGEYHRSSLAFDFVLLAILVVSTHQSLTWKHYSVVSLLLFLTAGTEFEMMGLVGLILLLYAVATRDRKLFSVTVVASVFAFGALLIFFPDWLGWHYFSTALATASTRPGYTIDDLIFWSLGSSVLIPFAVLGFIGLYLLVRSQSERRVSMPIFLFSVVIIAASLVAFSINSGSYAVRLIILLPVSMIFSIGLHFFLRLLRRTTIAFNFRGYPGTARLLFGLKLLFVIGLILSLLVAWGMTSATSAPDGVHYSQLSDETPVQFVGSTLMAPFIPTSAFPKLQLVRDYLQAHNLTVPIFMFKCGAEYPCYTSDLFRPYVYNAVGEHLAYFGDLSYLMKLRPTPFPPSNPYHAWGESLSSEYLSVMSGTQAYRTILPQIAVVTSPTQLLGHPLVYIVPEMDDGPPPQVLSYSIGNGVYVVPALSNIASQISQGG